MVAATAEVVFQELSIRRMIFVGNPRTASSQYSWRVFPKKRSSTAWSEAAWSITLEKYRDDGVLQMVVNGTAHGGSRVGIREGLNAPNLPCGRSDVVRSVLFCTRAVYSFVSCGCGRSFFNWASAAAPVSAQRMADGGWRRVVCLKAVWSDCCWSFLHPCWKRPVDWGWGPTVRSGCLRWHSRNLNLDLFDKTQWSSAFGCSQ